MMGISLLGVDPSNHLRLGVLYSRECQITPPPPTGKNTIKCLQVCFSVTKMGFVPMFRFILSLPQCLSVSRNARMVECVWMESVSAWETMLVLTASFQVS